MILPVIALLLLVLLLAEAAVLATVSHRDVARERAYWDARNDRPDLYDWAKELDL